MKIAYIAHPISGDIDKNIAKVLRIVREINLHSHKVVPFAPYIVDCLSLDDDIQEHRERGIRNNVELLKREFIEELWLFGDHISLGMHQEVSFALENGIKVKARTEGTRVELDEIISNHNLVEEVVQKKVDEMLNPNLETRNPQPE